LFFRGKTLDYSPKAPSWKKEKGKRKKEEGVESKKWSGGTKEFERMGEKRREEESGREEGERRSEVRT
jgi:hypothetical protein